MDRRGSCPNPVRCTAVVVPSGSWALAAFLLPGSWSSASPVGGMGSKSKSCEWKGSRTGGLLAAICQAPNAREGQHAHACTALASSCWASQDPARGRSTYQKGKGRAMGTVWFPLDTPPLCCAQQQVHHEIWGQPLTFLLPPPSDPGHSPLRVWWLAGDKARF